MRQQKLKAVLLMHWHSGNIYDDSLFLETTSYPRLSQEKMPFPVQIQYNWLQPQSLFSKCLDTKTSLFETQKNNCCCDSKVYYNTCFLMILWLKKHTIVYN